MKVADRHPRRSSSTTAVLAVYCAMCATRGLTVSTALAPPSPPSEPAAASSSRRAFFVRGTSAAAAAAFAPSAALPHSAVVGSSASAAAAAAACACAACLWGAVAPAAHAFERRDVGGSDASPETKAMNEQAYQTQSRLERAGVRLETAEEQSASLSAALSGYSYEASSGSPTTKKSKSASRKASGDEPSSKK